MQADRGGNGSGTFRGNCGREIDAIYVKNAGWLHSTSPNRTLCRAYPKSRRSQLESEPIHMSGPITR